MAFLHPGPMFSLRTMLQGESMLLASRVSQWFLWLRTGVSSVLGWNGAWGRKLDPFPNVGIAPILSSLQLLFKEIKLNCIKSIHTVKLSSRLSLKCICSRTDNLECQLNIPNLFKIPGWWCPIPEYTQLHDNAQLQSIWGLFLRSHINSVLLSWQLLILKPACRTLC